MQIGMIGLGRMGASMVTRLSLGKHDCVVHDQSPKGVARLVAMGATGSASLRQFVDALKAPRAVWLMVPAAAVDTLLERLAPLLKPGDIVIDGGNSHYHDNLRRAKGLAASGIAHVDVGTSGGVAGLERGYCLRIGGTKESVQHLAPVFATLAPGGGTAVPMPKRRTGSSSADQGWLHCGPGHADFANRVQSAMRHEFGGHIEKPAPGAPTGT